MDPDQPSRILSFTIAGTDVRVPLWEKGSGDLLLMLHGWGLDHTSLNGLQDQLAPLYRVVTTDLPGFGIAPLPGSEDGLEAGRAQEGTRAWGVGEYAELVAALVQALQPQGEVAILGHSFGGRIGLRLAAFHPARISHLILVASAGIRRPQPLWKRMQIQLVRGLGRLVKTLLPARVAQPLRAALIQRMASADYLAAGALRPTLVKVVNEDASLYASSIRVPTLLLWGELDSQTPPWVGQALARLIARASLFVLPNLNHHSILSAGRFQVAFLLRKFMQPLEPSGGSSPNAGGPPSVQESRPSVYV